ncbi:MAG TPA: enoyl-CoA hydratase-related protein [Candidatus Dormibacteraeota bacterium]|nr:enoyl-CoA hydratase-related protein [Candidatus Dormibacteraeota bacterium]
MSDIPHLEHVLVVADEGVARVVLNRPDQRNALSDGMVGDLLAALRWSAAESGVRVVVLTGAGERAFCAGADLGSFEQEVPELERHARRLPLAELLSLMPRLGKPIVGRINGHALAGGFGLACSCDLLVAAAGATFGTPEVNVGVWPAMIQAVLARNLPRKALLEMMLLGQRWSAGRLEAMGVVNRVAGSVEELDAITAEVAGAIAAKAPVAVGLGRDSFYRQQDMEFHAALDYLRDQLSLISLSQDAREGARAFLEKRQPHFEGR